MRGACLVALALLLAGRADAQPRNYVSAGVAASATGVGSGSYDYLGWDVYAGRRVLPWLALELAYRADLGQGSYPYPNQCSQMCCGSQLRSWEMQQLGARVTFVPLRTRYVDLSAGLGFAGLLARERRVRAPDFGTALVCYPPFDGEHGAAAASTFVSIELRPLKNVGLRVVGTLEFADIADWPLMTFGLGPVVWF